MDRGEAAAAAAATRSGGCRNDIVVVGAGLVGASTAFWLAQRVGGGEEGGSVTVLERADSVAAAASGKGGGFIARNWGDGATRRLHELGYDLHQQLAEKLNVTSFRQIKTLSVAANRRQKRRSRNDELVSWLDGPDVSRVELLDEETAQVSPRELCEKLMASAIENGVTLRTNCEVVGIEMGEGGCVQGVHVAEPNGTTSTVSASKVVVAMGPWAVRAADWLNIHIPMTGIKSTSIVFDGDARVASDPRALFCAEDANGCHMEVYPRRSGEVYCCGLGGSDYVNVERLLPGGDCDKPEKIFANLSRVNAGRASLSAISSIAKDAEPAIVQACMRPCAPDALPILGSVPSLHNDVVIATGMNCWGISWSPAVGKVVTELLLDGKSTSVPNLKPFDPLRFTSKFASKSSRGRHQGATSIGEQW